VHDDDDDNDDDYTTLVCYAAFSNILGLIYFLRVIGLRELCTDYGTALTS